MKNSKKWAIWLTGVLLAALSVSFTVFAKNEEKLFALAGSDGEMYSVYGPAYVLEENGQYLILGHSATLDAGADSYVIYNVADETVYPVEFTQQGISEYQLAIFRFMDEKPPREQILMPAAARQEQVASLLYLCEEGVRTGKVMIMEARESGSRIALDIEAVEDIADFYTPAAFLDDDGNMVALYTATGECIAFHTDLDTFYGRTGGQADPDGGRAEDGEEPDGGEGKEGSSGTGGTKMRAVPKRGDGLIKILLFGVVAAVGIAVIAAFIKKAKGDEAAPPARPCSNPGPASARSQASAAEICPASASAEGIAGPMMGRIYSVKSEGLTFGRDTSCFVCLPAETKGVSRVHCRLYPDEQGRLMLMDCGSSYGTYLHGFGKLSPRQPVAVNRGSVFYLGSKKVGFKIQ